MSRLFKGIMEFGIGSLKGAFKPFHLKLNLKSYNKLDKKAKDFKE